MAIERLAGYRRLIGCGFCEGLQRRLDNGSRRRFNCKLRDFRVCLERISQGIGGLKVVAGRPELFAAEIGGAAIGYSDLLPVSLVGLES